MLKRLDLGFEPWSRLLRRIRSCSWNREGESPKEGREPFPSPGGYIRLNVTDDSPTADPARVVESPAPGPSKQALKVFAFTSMWWIAAIMVILEIKQVVHDIFPFPFALTAMVQPTTALCAWLLSRLVHSKRPPAPPLQSHENMYVVVIGLVQGLEIGLTNKALEFLTVAARTMISSTSVLFMMCTARFWGLERLGLLRLCSSALMIMGGVFQCHVPELPGGRSSAHWLGMLMQMISMILSAQRWALAQFVLQRSPVGSGLAQTTKLQLLARTLPITGVVCLVLALLFERQSFSSDVSVPAILGFRVVSIACGLTGMLYAELKLVSLLSAVAFNVLSTLHQIPIVLAGVILQHNTVSISSWAGFACCLIGALVYAIARYSDVHE